jgi:cytochrome c biogenesis protein CcmG/thiol:disulfide interchange protein DsbE
MSGETFRLSDHRGEIVVVNFWATWCPPCRKEIPGFIQLQKEFGTEGMTIVGISLDDQGFEAVQPYAEEMGINYPLVVGSDRLTRKYGGVRALPTSFVVGPKGTVQYARPGFLPEAELRRQLQPLLKRLKTST